MGKPSQNQLSKRMAEEKESAEAEKQSAEARALLEGVFATGERSEAGIYTAHKGNLLVLGLSYEDASKLVEEAKELTPWKMVSFQTFYWTGKDMSKHQIAIEAKAIVEVVEVTEDAWGQHVTQKIEEAQAAALQRGGLQLG